MVKNDNLLLASFALNIELESLEKFGKLELNEEFVTPQNWHVKQKLTDLEMAPLCQWRMFFSLLWLFIHRGHRNLTQIYEFRKFSNFRLSDTDFEWITNGTSWEIGKNVDLNLWRTQIVFSYYQKNIFLFINASKKCSVKCLETWLLSFNSYIW